MENKIYIVYGYDPMPYSDESDYLVCAYTNKDDAEKRAHRNNLAREDDWDYTYSVRELELIA